MERIVRYFVERHLLVNVIVAFAVVGGFAVASRSAREGFPSVSIPILTVSAQLPGAAARDVETKLTLPLEEAIEEVDSVDSFHTVVTDNISLTTVELYEDLTEEEIRVGEQDLRTAVDGVTDFPDEMTDEPIITRLNPGKFPVLEIALSGPVDELPVAAHRLEQRLRRLEDVAQVSLVGLRDPEVRVLLDPARAREHGVTLLDVVSAIKRRNISNTGGILEVERERRQVVLWSRYERPEDVAASVLRFETDGAALRIADVARVESGREDTGLVAHTNGHSGVSVVVQKRVKADILDAANAIAATVEATPLPPGVEAILVNDESFMTRNRLEVMANNGLLGVVFVTAVVFLFLSPGAALWVVVGVPVVILGVLILMPFVGLTINLIALGGFVVVLGMLVDDAVVVSERILSRRQEGLDPTEAAVQGAVAVSRPVLASAITTVLAFMPMFAIGGMPGKIAWNMPAVVILCLVLSVFESFLILPSHMSLGRRGAQPVPKRRFVVRLERRYEAALRWVLPRRGRVVAAFALLFAATMILVMPRVGFVLFPQEDSDGLSVRVTAQLGTPLEQTEGIAASIEQQLIGLMQDDLLAVTARIGHQDALAVERERGSAEHEAVVSAMLRPVGRQYTAAEWAERLRSRLRVPEGVDLVYEPEILGPPIGRPVTIHAAGNNDEVRRSTAASIARYLAGLDGVVDVDIDEKPGVRQLDLNLDYDRLALRGLDAEDVGLTLKAAFFGLEASEHRDLEETTTYRVMFEPSSRRSLDALLEAPVRNRRGELVRLRDVVDPVEVPAVSRILHREGLRCATITANLTPEGGLTAGSLAARLEGELLPHFAARSDIDVYLGGEVVETRKTTRDLRTVALLSLAGIATVIALMLGSFLEAAFVVSVIPFALIGVVLTFFLHGQDLSMFAMIGTIGLAGVVVNTSIVMVDSIHERVKGVSGDDPEVRQTAIVDAVVTRLRPVLVTSLSTLGGVLPTAYGLGGRDAVLSPMSLALGWGLAFSTIITLFLVPSLYVVAGDLRERVSRARHRASTG